MAKKTLQLVDATAPATAIMPPRALGTHGTALWQSILREYDIGDAGGREMLAQACSALDRSEGRRSHLFEPESVAPGASYPAGRS